MKVFPLALLILSMSISIQSNAQSCIPSAKAFHKALVTKDKTQLDILLHDSLSYGHSNGWIEDKETLVKNNQTMYLEYVAFIDSSDYSEQKIQQTHILRFNTSIHYKLNTEPPLENTVRFAVLEVWERIHGQCMLLARQSTLLK